MATRPSMRVLYRLLMTFESGHTKLSDQTYTASEIPSVLAEFDWSGGATKVKVVRA